MGYSSVLTIQDLHPKALGQRREDRGMDNLFLGSGVKILAQAPRGLNRRIRVIPLYGNSNRLG